MDDYLVEISKTYGLVFRLCFWNQVAVFVLDPECIKDVLVTGNHQKSKRFYSRLTSVFGTRFIGQGLETQLDSKHWIMQRIHFDQWFKPSYIRQFASEFNVFADSYTKYLETSADGKTEIHLLHSFNKLTMHLLYKVAFSVDMGPLHGKNHPFVTKMKTAMSGFSALLANPLVDPFKWGFRREVRGAINFIRGSAKQMMIDRKVAMHLDQWFMSKLQREIDENVGAVSGISLNEIEKLSYLDMVLKETLRLYPVGKATFRGTIRDYNLGGHLIPAGTDMMVSFYATSRAGQNIRDPTKFSPERFHIDSSDKFSKYASTPFSAGPHTCIGKKFTEIQIKITISKIMQNFDFELVPGQTCDLADNATLQAKDGVKCFFLF
ncbi:cholesterol 24-hydroxylase-like [Mizuhopecten yessoensis]|uniref:cholesterol 24-hydroxylase-like n=1 Tax=Mizuhopecten yessoensis TaxID=6573 RepID=UPI000B45E44C|nr:cholesterol 24-hydroxylase-like [Mizuhopecten yessoensis]